MWSNLSAIQDCCFDGRSISIWETGGLKIDYWNDIRCGFCFIFDPVCSLFRRCLWKTEGWILRMTKIDYIRNPRKWKCFKESAYEQINIAFCKLRRLGYDDKLILAVSENLLQRIPDLEKEGWRLSVPEPDTIGEMLREIFPLFVADGVFLAIALIIWLLLTRPFLRWTIIKRFKKEEWKLYYSRTCKRCYYYDSYFAKVKEEDDDIGPPSPCAECKRWWPDQFVEKEEWNLNIVQIDSMILFFWLMFLLITGAILGYVLGRLDSIWVSLNLTHSEKC